MRVNQTAVLSGLSFSKVSAMFAAFRDVVAWYVVESGRNVSFDSGEVDCDAAKTATLRRDGEHN
eukprot:3957563-Pyramimonas_sp.AAC.1